MEKMNSGKVVDYIDGARDWLEKAKTEYSQENPAGGELILNLAQAEIKYAWELSRANFVSDSEKKPVPNRKLKMILPVAASLLLLLGAGLWSQTGRLNMSKNAPSLKETTNPVVKQSLVASAGQNRQTAKAEKPLNNTGQSLNKEEPPVNAQNELKTESKPLDETGRPVRNTNPIGNTTLSDQSRDKDNSIMPPNIQPVSKLAIDEEALAKEASHSLRNGK